MQQRLITVDKTAVEKLYRHLDMLNREANAVSADKSAMEIKACKKLLFKAMGILQAMKQLELLANDEIEFIREDQERIENKITNIICEKKKASQGRPSK